MTEWDYLVVEPIRAMLNKFGSFIPTLVGALLILIIGWIVAKILRELSHKLLDAIRFETIAKKAGITDILDEGGIKVSASELISRLIYWLVMVVVLVMTINALGLTVASQLLERLTSYIPKVISALFVLVIGMFLANVISAIVRTTANNAKLPKPDLLSSLCRWAILVFTFMVFLDELGIAMILVSVTFNIFFGAVCLALALSFGLGGKEVAQKYLHDWVSRFSR